MKKTAKKTAKKIAASRKNLHPGTRRRGAVYATLHVKLNEKEYNKLGRLSRTNRKNIAEIVRGWIEAA